MIAVILIWTYIGLMSFIIGFTFLSFIKKTGLIEGQTPLSILQSSIVGLGILATVTGYFSIFYKVGLALNIIFILVSIVLGYIYKAAFKSFITNTIEVFKKTPYIVLLLHAAVFIFFLFRATDHPMYGDTGLYHAQNIKWINEYSVLPGLGNFHGRFAFNNHSLLLEALFSLSFLNVQTFHVLNSYLLLLLFFTVIHLLGLSILRNDKLFIVWFGLLFLMGQDQLAFFSGKWISSPAPGIFATALNLFIFIIYIRTLQNREYSFTIHHFSIVLLSFFAITIKISSVIILLLPLYILFTTPPNIRLCIFASSLIIIIIIPFLIRNVFLSGYLLYPVPYIDFFSFDWKIPIASVVSMKNIICSWAQTMPYDPNIKRSLLQWVPIWITPQPFERLVYFLFSLLSPFFLILYYFFIKEKDKVVNDTTPLILISFVGILFWFLTAPDFRFVYDVLWINILLTIMLLFEIVKKVATSHCNKIIPVSFITCNFKGIQIFIIYIFCIFLIYDYSKGILSSPIERIISQNIILPEKYKRVEAEKINVNNFYYYKPYSDPSKKIWGDCWNHALPCYAYDSSHVELRGESFEAGFRIKQK